jgi:hypothetical protein
VTDDNVALDLHMRDLFKELGDVRDTLARLEKLMVRIALSLGIKPDG